MPHLCRFLKRVRTRFQHFHIHMRMRLRNHSSVSLRMHFYEFVSNYPNQSRSSLIPFAFRAILPRAAFCCFRLFSFHRVNKVLLVWLSFAFRLRPRALRRRLLWHLLTSVGSLLLLALRLAPQTSPIKNIIFQSYTPLIYSRQSG